MKSEPIDILFELAKEGEIDPWDVDIIKATDIFLERLEEKDLIRSGRAFMYASILLRMKSEAVIENGKKQENGQHRTETIDNNTDIKENSEKTGIEALEKEFEDRLNSSDKGRSNKNITTLNDLIQEIKDRENSWKQKREYKKVETKESSHNSLPFSIEEPDQARHEEDIEEVIEKVEKKLKKLFNNKSYVPLDSLVEDKNKKVTIYVSLLFLASRGKIQLEQDRLYGELLINNLSL